MKLQIYTTLFSASLLLTNLSLSKPPIPTPLDTPVVGEWDEYLLKTLYKEKNNDTGLVHIVEEDRFKELTTKHHIKLLGGPMLGCVTDTSARFWLRTPGEAQAQVIIGDNKSSIVTTKAKDDYTGLLDINNLTPNTTYNYDVLVNGESIYQGDKPSFQTYPKTTGKTNIKIAFGGCARYNPPKEHMWELIASHNPHAFLFLGDNVYIDKPQSRTKQRVHYYRRQLRPEFQKLVASSSIYSIYDDHDLGANDTSGGLHPFEPAWKYESWKVFRENWNNPAYGMGDSYPGCWFDFSIGDIDVFMLDNRYNRDFKQGTIMGPVQKAWLIEKLKASTATFKIIASGTLWTELADKNGKDSWWGVKEEREELFSTIDRENIGGVLLLSSDRHRTDVYKIERPNGYPLYEFESGNITNNHIHDTNKKAVFSFNEGNHFGSLDFDLTKEDPEVTFQCITQDNKSVYSLTLKRSQMQKTTTPSK